MEELKKPLNLSQEEEDEKFFMQHVAPEKRHATSEDKKDLKKL